MERTDFSVDDDLQLLLARAILIGLTYNKEILLNIFKDRITKEDISQLNYKRKKTYNIEIHKGLITNDQINQIRDYRRAIQFGLALILYKLCGITEGKNGVDIIDEFANKLHVQIKIFDKDRKEIYKTPAADVQIKILFHNNKYFHISRESCITTTKLKKINTMKISYTLNSQ